MLTVIDSGIRVYSLLLFGLFKIISFKSPEFGGNTTEDFSLVYQSQTVSQSPQVLNAAVQAPHQPSLGEPIIQPSVNIKTSRYCKTLMNTFFDRLSKAIREMETQG